MSEPDATSPDVGARAVEAVLGRLNVAADGADAFFATRGGGMGPRLFGGLVAGQAVVAAARTVDSLPLHSLHAYFLQPGNPELDIRYRVERLKEGRNFHVRQVTGRQDDRVIFSMQASFCRPEAGISHGNAMPDVPAPEAVGEHGWGFWGNSSPVRIRDCDGSFDAAAEQGERRLWIRPAAALPEDPVLHLALLVFASDMSLMMTGLLPHPELRSRQRGGASLDHALWLHRPVAFDDWLLYTMQTPVAHAGRPLVTGAMYRRDGTRVVSVAQEGLIRPR